MAIPLIAIKSIDKVEYPVKLKKNDKKGAVLVANMFEIFLKEDFLDLYMRPDYERLFNPDTKRVSHSLRNISNVEAATSPKGLKERFILEEENTPLEPLGSRAM